MRREIRKLSPLIVAVLLAACQNVGAPVPSASAGASAAKAPLIDVLRFGAQGRAVSADPLKISGIQTYQVSMLTSGELFRLTSSGQVAPDLVQTSQASTDGLVYTMTLNPDLKYSDGTPLVADDVVASFNRVRKAPQTNTVLISGVTDVTAKDARTLEWKLSAPQAYFTTWFGLGWMPIHPRAKVEADTSYFDHPVSAGPYMLSPDWAPNSVTSVVVANPNYVHAPMAIREIQFIYVADLTTRALQLAQGQLDIVQDLPAAALSALPASVTAKPGPIGGTYFVGFNDRVKTGPLADRSVRKAIALALNRTDIMSRGFQGLGRPTSSVAFPDTQEFSAAASFLPSVSSQDLSGARQALAASAFAGGFETTLQVAGTRAGWKDSALIVQQQLAQIGIKVSVDSLEDTVAFGNLAAGKYDMGFFGLGGYPYVPLMWYTQALGVGGVGQAWTACKDDQIEDLMSKARVAPTAAAAAPLWIQMEQRNAQTLCIIPVGERVEGHAWVDSKVKSSFGFTALSSFLYVKTFADATK